MTSKIRLPNFNGIQIDNISNEDEILASFLKDCAPFDLRLLSINNLSVNSTVIKSKLYIDGFSELAKRTKKEIFLNRINFREKDFQTIVKAARNSERIMFNHCCLHFSPVLDLGADLSFYTKYLSFKNWDITKWVETETKWSKEWEEEREESPWHFTYIVNAIGYSGLRRSLDKINIYEKQTQSRSAIQNEFKKRSMQHITIVEENVNPILS